MLSVPEVARTGLAITLRWGPESLVAIFSQWRESRGEVKAVLTVSTSAPGFASHLHESQITVSSLAARSTLAKHLEKIAAGVTDWATWTEQACVIALRNFRHGEPALRLVPAALTQGPTWRVNPLVYDKLPAVIYGPGGSRKSFVGLWLALLVETGVAVAGVHAVPGRALYLDWESDAEIANYRLGRFIDGQPELAAAAPMYRRMTQTLVNDLPSLSRLIAEQEIRFLVVDSLAMACGGVDLADPATAIDYFMALRQLSCASLSIAHVPKNAETPTIYGSVFFGNIARMTWEIKCDTDEESGTSTIGLFNRKFNEKKRPPIGFQFLHDPLSEAITVKPTILTDTDAFLESSPLWVKIQHYCEAGAKSTKTLSQLTEKSFAAVYNELQRMEEKGRIMRLGEGKGTEWILPPKPNETPSG